MCTSLACARQRTFKIIQLANVSKGIVRVTIGDKSSDYAYDVLRIDRELGQCALELKKLEPESEAYHVLLAHDGSTECDCRGFLRWGSQTGRCKHCDLAWPLIEETRRQLTQMEHAEARAAVEQSRLHVRQQSEQTLVIETPTGEPVASIECASGLTDDHVRNANIAANPVELVEPERMQANVEQLPETTVKLTSFSWRRDSANRLAIVDPSGRERIVIDCTAGIIDQHERVAALLVREPRLLNFPAATKACLGQIPGTTVLVA